MEENKILAAQLLAQGTEKQEAAKIAGISRTTLYNWMKDENFIAEVDRVKQEIRSLGLNMIAGKLNKAVEDYWKLITNTKNERVKAEGYQYFINHNLGKPTTKLDIEAGMKETRNTDVDLLEKEFEEFDD